MNYVLFDPEWRHQLLPFTHTRPVADIRCGILSFRERWERLLGDLSYSLCPNYLQEVFPQPQSGDCLYLNGGIFATESLVQQAKHLSAGSVLLSGTTIVAFRTDTPFPGPWEAVHQYALGCEQVSCSDTIESVQQPWHIFQKNDAAIRNDFALMTQGQTSEALPSFVTAIGSENIFIAAGARVGPCILNASGGPIYIAEDAEIMEGCLVRGPFALGAHATLKMGAKVYGATTIGAACKVGGEVSNVVFFANSNKGHDGFLGNSVVGEWCNFGADTNCSNLKNNYDTVKIWSEQQQQLVTTGLQFCGLMMGDHSKCGINTMFNTGTVVGVSANIFGSGFPDKYVPSFTWGGCEQSETYQFDKAMETAARMMERRGKQLLEPERNMLLHIFNSTINETH